jgi:NADH:ubiquinone oxidoreductase subunit 2 (subunit N)
MYRLWSPLKHTGRKLNFLTVKRFITIFIPLYILGAICLLNEDLIPVYLHHYIAAFFSLIGMVLVLKSFTERKNVYLAWSLIIMNHFWIALAILFNEHFKYDQTILYLSGIVVSGFVGFLCLRRLKNIELNNVDLNQFHGHVYEHPRIAFMFLLACLGLTGFPITPTFIGEDVIFSHIHEDQFGLALFTATSLIVDGIAVVRIYARVFLGPHVKTYHESAYRSS